MTQSRSACAAQAVDDGWPLRVSIRRDTMRQQNEAKVNMFQVLSRYELGLDSET